MKQLFIIFLFAVGFLDAQNYKITYRTASNGKDIPTQDPVIVYASPAESYILSEKMLAGSKPFPYEFQKIMSRESRFTAFGMLSEGEIASYSDAESIGKQQFSLKPETKKILGYTCQRATTSINSNSIEIWYTNQLKITGGPSLLGQSLGLVLESSRNGNTVTRAVSIEKVKPFNPGKLLAGKTITATDELSYKDLLWKSRFTTLPVFSDETINFSNAAKSDEKIMRYANGTVILKKVKFPDLSAQNNIFVQLREQSAGDAYDRTGSVFFIPQNKEKSFFDALSKGIDTVPTYENGSGKVYKGVVQTAQYEPAIELMRFFTPFGVKQFNYLKLKDKKWHDEVMYRQDISEFQPALSGRELWVGAFIGNYDGGGHKVSLEITIHRDGLNVFRNNTAISLFNTLNVMEMAGQPYATMFSQEKGLELNFTLAKDLKNAQLRYISTGHGGWENGDEFVPKENRIFMDGRKVFAFTPWRTDCGSYRLYNPASGNFGNGLSSSDYSRSNWCPGTTTNPIYISLGDLTAGTHSVRVQIPQGANEGNSFSSWNVSGVLLGEQ